MSYHAPRSPSARHRHGACPGSLREEQKYPRQPSGAAAIDGTHTHTLLEHCLIQHLPASAFIGQDLCDYEGSFNIDKERAERVQFALDYVHTASNAGQSVYAERLVNPGVLVGRGDMSGTVDVQIIGKTTIEIIDYKDGMALVNAENNPQLEQYAVGTIAEMIATSKPLPEYVRMTIIQPKLREKGLSGLSSQTVSLDYVMQIKDKLIAEGKAGDDPNAPLTPGESQCRYCAHKGNCTALVNKALTDSGVSFKDLTSSSITDPHHMSDSEILQIIEFAPLLLAMIKGVEIEAQRRLEAGEVIKGLKMVKGRGSRSWAFDDEAMAKSLKKFGLPKNVIYTTSLISVAQAEKATWTKGDKEVSLSKIQIERLKKEYIKQTDGKLTLALESDSRAAVTVTNVSEMFSEAIPSWLSNGV